MAPRDKRSSVENRVDFREQKIRPWKDFYDLVSDLKPSYDYGSGDDVKSGLSTHGWIYRGQTHDLPLKTSFERALFDWKIPFEWALETEWQTIREFQRRTLDPLYKRVHDDTLFCLALMQHHGAPTRLLDCSYSPFAAAAFAMEKGPQGENKVPVVWCFSMKWPWDKTEENTKHKQAFKLRNKDDKRNDQTFLKLYNVGAKAKPSLSERFVKSENPLQLNERLSTQQGVFLCPADVTVSFEKNCTSSEHFGH
jgi:FRG domain